MIGDVETIGHADTELLKEALILLAKKGAKHD